jgi:hypothetical protein
MLQYVDGFSCSLNQNSNSLVIHFTQKEPIVKENNEVQTVVNPITSIIMEKDSARALLSVLQDVYGDAPSSEDQ